MKVNRAHCIENSSQLESLFQRNGDPRRDIAEICRQGQCVLDDSAICQVFQAGS